MNDMNDLDSATAQKWDYCTKRMEKFGGLVIKLKEFIDFPVAGKKAMGYVIYPVRSDIVACFDTYNWGIGVGPYLTKEMAIERLYYNLSGCLKIAIGKAGLHKEKEKESVKYDRKGEQHR